MKKDGEEIELESKDINYSVIFDMNSRGSILA